LHEVERLSTGVPGLSSPPLDKCYILLYIMYRMYNTDEAYTASGGKGNMEKTLGVTEARKELARIIDEVKYKGNNYIIVRRGEPAAAVVPMDVYERWKKEREALFDVIRKIRAANADADPDQVMREVLEAQQAVRRSAVE
jgi:prevent-host-death family protein